MEKIGTIEIRVSGKLGINDLTPDNYDIKHIVSILQNVQDLMYPNNNKDRPLITYDLKSGSVRHIFKTSMQYVIGFSAVLMQVKATNSIDFLVLKTSRAIENLQNLSQQNNYEIDISTSVNPDIFLRIDPSTTFLKTEDVWVDAEFYMYGILKDAGGKNKANIHIDTDDYGYLAFETGQDFLMNQKENLLYKRYGVRAIGKQNIETGEIDTRTLKLLELINYDPLFDMDYIERLIEKASGKWENLDVDEYMSEVRGFYE